MRIMSRLWVSVGLAAFLVLSPGCGDEEQPKPPENQPEAASGGGVGDAVDYAIGRKQIEIMKESEKKIDRIKKEHDQQLKEAMEE